MIKINFLSLLTAILIFTTTQKAEASKDLYFKYTPTALTHVVSDTAAVGILGTAGYAIYNSLANVYYCLKPLETPEDAAHNKEKAAQYYLNSLEAFAAMTGCAALAHLAFLKSWTRITEVAL